MKTMSLLILALGFYSLTAQEIHTPSGFVSDFDYLIEKLEETHPDPYTGFGGRPFFFREKEDIREQLQEVTDTTQFIQIINHFLSHIRDGHTTIYDRQAKGMNEMKFFPMQFQIAQDGLFIENTMYPYQAVRGGMIQAINNIPVETLLEKASSVYPCENRFGSYLTLRNLLHNTVAAEALFGKTESLELTVLKDNHVYQKKIDYMDRFQYPRPVSFTQYEKENPILFSKMIDGAGYIRWNTVLARELIEADLNHGQNQSGFMEWAFSYLPEEPIGDAWKDMEKVPSLYQTFAETLQQMKKERSKNLIIDLRYNGGGMTPMIYPVLYMLFDEKLLTTDFNDRYDVRISPLYLQKNQSDLETYNQRNGTNLKLGDFKKGWLSAMNPSQTIEYKRESVKGWRGVGENYIREGMKNRPDSLQVYVLVSPQTFSAAYHFTFFLWKLGAKVVGVTSSQAGNCFMENTQFTLPSTGLQGSISNAIQVLFPYDPAMGKEFIPDVPVYLEDYQKYNFDVDAPVLKTLDLIRNNRE